MCEALVHVPLTAVTFETLGTGARETVELVVADASVIARAHETVVNVLLHCVQNETVI